ncbi:hypothetical protein MNBD_GAMMA21-568 [hydrothermal vent metagenome]|uniref:Uncharacterized protein n=1 Tax=hydrothermal vent metagenome TaxID=652676 RepID=A0A3B1A3E3_9ZZZZ
MASFVLLSMEEVRLQVEKLAWARRIKTEHTKNTKTHIKHQHGVFSIWNVPMSQEHTDVRSDPSLFLFGQAKRK